LTVSTFSNIEYGCTNEDLNSFLILAKNAYENETWTRYNIKQLKNIIAGITVNDLRTYLNPALVSSIEPNAFSLMSLSVLEEILKSNETLEYLDRDQLFNIQLNPNYKYLSSNSLNSLNKNYNSNFDLLKINDPTASTSTVRYAVNNNIQNISSACWLKYNMFLMLVLLIISLKAL
jgi:hypothetical protein